MTSAVLLVAPLPLSANCYTMLRSEYYLLFEYYEESPLKTLSLLTSVFRSRRTRHPPRFAHQCEGAGAIAPVLSMVMPPEPKLWCSGAVPQARAAAGHK